MDYVSPLEAVFPGAGASIVEVLARTERPLTLRQIADRAGVSHPQVGRHVERLEALGVVRRDVVGRSHQVTLANSAAGYLIRRFTRLDEEVLERMRTTAGPLEPNAASVVVFGSFARGTADAVSDIDIAIVAHDPTDEAWLEQLTSWVDEVAEFAGNPVAEILISTAQLAGRADDPVWASVRSDGITIAGRPIPELLQHAVAESGR